MQLVEAGSALLAKIFLCLLFTGMQLNAQTYPLRIKDKHIVTKNQRPFLVNGRGADIYGNLPNELHNLQRYSYFGINTAFVTLPQHSMDLTKEGQPTRYLVKKLKLLRTFAKEASLYNIAVFVAFENPDSSRKDYSRNNYQQYAFKTLFRNKNVTWILNYRDINSEAFHPNKNQLIAEPATDASGNAHFLVQTKSPCLNQNGSKPIVLLIETESNQPDSLFHNVLETAYTGIMNGAGGIIVLNRSSVNTLYNPVSQQLKQWAVTFDSLSWQSFITFPDLIASESANLNIRAVTTSDSLLSAIYFKQLTTLHLNLSFFKSKLRFSWVNTVNGKLIETLINPFPRYQLFMPPVTDAKADEWLLIISPLSTKKLQ